MKYNKYKNKRIYYNFYKFNNIEINFSKSNFNRKFYNIINNRFRNLILYYKSKL